MKTEIIPIASRTEWLKLRTQDVTASDVAALFGLHPYKSALQVYADKTNRTKGRADSAVMHRGRILEAGAPIALQEDYPSWRIEKANHYWRAPELRIGATPDYLRVFEPVNMESVPDEPLDVKTVLPQIFERDWADGPPLAWQLQVLTQAMLMGASRGWLAVLIDNYAKDLEIYEVTVHAAAWDKIVERVAKFWRDVEAGTMPEADYTKDGGILGELFPPRTSLAVDLSGDNELPALLDERERLKAELKQTDARIDAIDAEIVHKLNSSEEGRLSGWKITNKMQHRKEYTVKATSFPVLRVTRLKELAA